MLTLASAVANPGILDSPESPDWIIPLLIVAIVSTAAAVVSVFDKTVPARKRVLQIASVVAIVSVPLAVILITAAVTDRNNAVDDHRETTRAWLASDYGIDVTADETKALIGIDRSKKYGPTELVVDLDGELTSIKLIEGTGSTLQVKVVGGKVLQPRN